MSSLHAVFSHYTQPALDTTLHVKVNDGICKGNKSDAKYLMENKSKGLSGNIPNRPKCFYVLFKQKKMAKKTEACALKVNY